MRIGDAEYVARVQQLLDEGKAVSRSEARRVIAQRECEPSHTRQTLSPEACAQEVASIVPPVMAGTFTKTATGMTENWTGGREEPKKRGWPKGKKRGPKPK